MSNTGRVPVNCNKYTCLIESKAFLGSQNCILQRDTFHTSRLRNSTRLDNTPECLTSPEASGRPREA